MARLITAGFETANDDLESLSVSIGTRTYDTTTVRSGTRSLKMVPASGFSQVAFPFAGFLEVTYWVRAYIRYATLPDNPNEARLLNHSSTLGVTIDSNGIVQVHGDGFSTDVTSAVIVANTWYRLEMMLLVSASSNDAYEVRLDGTTISSASGLNLSSSARTFFELGGPQGTGVTDIFYDDVVLNDSNGGSQNGFPGDGKAVLLLPVSDNARASLWTGGAGGTTSLFEAVNNTPPIGTATETNLTQIEHAGGAAGTTDAYDANMTTYTAAGIGSTDTINCIAMYMADGEDVATGAKVLDYEVVSNPAIAALGGNAAGNDVGALGTYPTNWLIQRNKGTTYGPSVTVGTSPIMRVVRPETASRVASVCFMGLYVDYTPAPTGAGQAVWTTPLDGATIGASDPLLFTMPSSPDAMHFEVQIDDNSGFSSPDVFLSHVDQAGWEYWNGSSWTAVPQAGVSASFAGNEARYTPQTPLTGTIYRRVRAGVL